VISAWFHKNRRCAVPLPAELHATLQGAFTWRNQCHDRAILQGVIQNENRFSPYFIYFLFLMQFGLWRAAGFASSPIHLFNCLLSPRLLSSCQSPVPCVLLQIAWSREATAVCPPRSAQLSRQWLENARSQAQCRQVPSSRYHSDRYSHRFYCA